MMLWSALSNPTVAQIVVWWREIPFTHVVFARDLSADQFMGNLFARKGLCVSPYGREQSVGLPLDQIIC
ncbi:MAG: hypothetical protein DMG36_20635 [Acidobacteria bacterium]|nr:MAG: hypothetical protein DMG36_20635 [Acidobacteriota bacterium]